MSYILDALRKADAERDRGSVPDLHAQPVLRPVGRGAPPTAPLRWLPLAGAFVAVLIALAVAAWALWTREPRSVLDTRGVAAGSAVPPVLPAPAANADAPPTAQMAGSTPTPSPAPVAVAQTPAAVRTVPTPRATARQPATEGRPTAAARQVNTDPVADGPTATPRTATGAESPSSTRPSTTPRPSVPEPRVFTVAELPEEIRRELPALAIGGAMYAETPANRMLIVNGQVFHERDRLAPNLTLLQIRLKSAVLDFRGYRYSVGY
jgi:general secretion pathway protein B